ncbi:hypothetical protein [Candidatus Soleaferrea massiliensis]|uniref:hypothetical protein n=1 Tax=Candidatus Soleaferrea massiliensis TaxID=1470354 RepID=UPI00058C5FB6|nr:hypothetical protein [Candidatus Soleaferrea massiliensis]
MPKQKSSYRIALGGLITALSILFLFMTGVIPFGTFALPTLAGAVLVAIVIEFSGKTALLTYIAVSILAVFITPDREAALLFVFFFGYYPILKEKLEMLKSKVISYLIKFAVFNVSIAAAYSLLIFLFQLPVFEAFGVYGIWGIIGLWVVANLVFILYDVALTRVISMYVNWFRPKFLRKLH